MAAVPADCVFGQDNVTVSALSDGFPVYAGYYNGPFANLTALRARFPHAFIITIAIRLNGSKGSMCADIEPGTMSASQSGSFDACLAWLRQGGIPGKPLIYVMASWAAALERFLAAHGYSRDSYNMWTAHYAGLHLCSPSGCGYGGTRQADATQYASGTNDYDVFRGYVIHGTTTPPPAPAPVYPTLGSTGDAVKLVQTELNKWARYVGFGTLLVDGDFGGKTYADVMAFQKKEGLAADGVVGPLTSAALTKNPPAVVVPPPVAKPVVPSGNPNLVYGMVSKQVAAMQYYLRNSGLRGVRGISADGSFGNQTLTSLKNFQVHVGLNPDGVYGPATAKQLAKYAVH